MAVTDDQGAARRPPSSEIVEVVQVGGDDGSWAEVDAYSFPPPREELAQLELTDAALAIDDGRTPA
jgi:hypothetical protein